MVNCTWTFVLLPQELAAKQMFQNTTPLVLMAKIEKAWHESRNILANSAPAVCTVYSRWLAGLITQRFNMPPIMNSNFANFICLFLPDSFL